MIVDFIVSGTDPSPGPDDDFIYNISVRFDEHYEAANFTILIPRGHSRPATEANAHAKARQLTSQFVADLLNRADDPALPNYPQPNAA